MSSNRMPGDGKSGNWRKDFWRLILRLESSAVLAEAEEASLPLAFSADGVVGGGLEESEEVRVRVRGSEVDMAKKSGRFESQIIRV